MPVPRRLLTPGEEIVVEFRPHWAFFGWPLVATVVAVTVALVVAGTSLPGWLGYITLGLVAVAALWFAGRFLRWASTTTAVTTVRVLRRSGALARTGLEVRLTRINELAFRQTLFQRMLGCGDLLIETGGESGDIAFDFVPRPADVQSLITGELNELHRRQVDPQGPVPAVAGQAVVLPQGLATPPTGSPRVGSQPADRTVAERLVELDELRRRGILTAAEFDAKKAQLISQL